MPVENALSKQNIQDRYHGKNDPVANKILNTHATSMGLAPPEDQNIVCSKLSRLRRMTDILRQTSLFLTTLPASATEQSLRTRVLQSLPALTPAQIKSVVHVEKSRYAHLPIYTVSID